MQKHDDGFKVVASFRRKLTRNACYFICALKHFLLYMIWKNFKIVTDCNAVKATAKKQKILPRFSVWWFYLQDFNFEIIYGPDRKIVDYLSYKQPVDAAHHEITHVETVHPCLLSV